MSNTFYKRTQKQIDGLLKEREVFIARKDYWEANKLGEKIRGLRNQLDLSDSDRAILNMNARFAREHSGH